MVRYTCLNCQVAFADADIQREHYKSDWHRYNLKRKISELPPVTAEEFDRRVLVLRNENEKKRLGKCYTYCAVCKKSFSSDKSFENHLQSRRHDEVRRARSADECDANIARPSLKNSTTKRDNVIVVVLPSEREATTAPAEEDDFESVSSGSDEWLETISENNPILRNDCLFCDHHSASLTKNIKHMSAAHSFFIPYVEYVADMKGLLLYLGEKVCRDRTCLWCGSDSDNDLKNSFVSLEAVRSHMVDKGHAKIRSDTEASLEYLDFYDFSSTYGDDEEGGDKLQLHDSSSSSSFASVSKKAADDTNDAHPVSMLLPSGEVICHRSLIKYFRQNPALAKNRTSSTKKSKVQKLIHYYRSLGWNPTQRELVKKKVNDIKYINYVRSKYETKLKIKANKLQKHYRPQVDF